MKSQGQSLWRRLGWMSGLIVVVLVLGAPTVSAQDDDWHEEFEEEFEDDEFEDEEFAEDFEEDFEDDFEEDEEFEDFEDEEDHEDFDDEDEDDFDEDFDPQDAPSDIRGYWRREGRLYEADILLVLNLSDRGLRQLKRQGFFVQRRSPLPALGLELLRLQIPRSSTTSEALQAIAQADPSAVGGPNLRYRLAATQPAARPLHLQSSSSHCQGIRCYGQNLVGWPEQGCAMPLRIGLLDTAVDTSALGRQSQQLEQRRFADGRARRQDREHGTAVASVIVGSAQSNALLPQAQLRVADLFAPDAQGRLQSDGELMLEALNWLLAWEPHVINASLAGPPDPVLAIAVGQVLKKGVPIVAAAGNVGPRAPPQYPAAYPGVWAITAVDRRTQIYPRAATGPHIYLAAPGVSLWTASAGGQGRFQDGTSFAAPFASAAAAILKAGARHAQLATLRQRLQSQATDLGQPGFDRVFGWGLLQFPGCAHPRVSAAAGIAPSQSP